MDTAVSLTLAIAGWTLFGLAILVGLALDMLGLFGNWIILAAVGIAAAATGFDHFGGYTLIFLFALAVVGEFLEAAAAGVGAARYGGGRGAIFAALVGAIAGAAVGTSFFPIVGTIIGACVGAFVLATLYEALVRNQRWGSAARTGYGAALGKIGGLIAKTSVGVVMLLIAFLNY